MPFIQTAQNVRVDEGHILRASLQKGDGNWVDAEIDLNNHVGNNNGMLLVSSNHTSLPFCRAQV
jgi:hypothetical protein